MGRSSRKGARPPGMRSPRKSFLSIASITGKIIEGKSISPEEYEFLQEEIKKLHSNPEERKTYEELLAFREDATLATSNGNPQENTNNIPMGSRNPHSPIPSPSNPDPGFLPKPEPYDPDALDPFPRDPDPGFLPKPEPEPYDPDIDLPPNLEPEPEALPPMTANQSCKQCKIRPADGSDGLCSICRDTEGSAAAPGGRRWVDLVTVPELTGLTRFLAFRRAKKAELIAEDDSFDKAPRHVGLTVQNQSPIAGSMVSRGSIVRLSYISAGNIEYARDDYAGEVTYRNEKGQLHNPDGPAKIEPASGGRAYREVWWLDGKIQRPDGGPTSTDYYKDGTVREEWEVDGKLHREDGPAILKRDDETGRPIYKEYWQVRDGESLLHNDSGPAAYGRRVGRDGKEEEIEVYALWGEELSYEEWLARRLA